MKVAERVICAIDDFAQSKYEAALTHALISVDATSKRLFPTDKGVGVRYKKCIRHYYWLMEPMIGAGLNFAETRFSNLQLKNNRNPDLADFIYEIFRCGHLHGDEIPVQFTLTPATVPFCHSWELAFNEMHMPETLLWALLAICVLSNANYREKTASGHFLTLGFEKFLIRDWWGKESEFRPIADRYNVTRVTLEKLDRLEPRPDGAERREENILIFNPPFLKHHPS